MRQCATDRCRVSECGTFNVCRGVLDHPVFEGEPPDVSLAVASRGCPSSKMTAHKWSSQRYIRSLPNAPACSLVTEQDELSIASKVRCTGSRSPERNDAP
jgi:hypothetical protein